MASDLSSDDKPSFNQIIPTNVDIERPEPEPELGESNYSKRAQWLRAAVLGANDGLLSIAALMVGIGAVKKDVKTMVLTGLAGLFGGACSMALGELISVYSQYEIELAQLLRQHKGPDQAHQLAQKKKALPSPFQAAGASGLAFAIGAVVPLLAAAFIKTYKVRLAVVVATVSLMLVIFGWLGAVLGRAPPMKSTVRVLVGGWVALGVTFGLTKLVGFAGI